MASNSCMASRHHSDCTWSVKCCSGLRASCCEESSIANLRYSTWWGGVELWRIHPQNCGGGGEVKWLSHQGHLNFLPDMCQAYSISKGHKSFACNSYYLNLNVGLMTCWTGSPSPFPSIVTSQMKPYLHIQDWHFHMHLVPCKVQYYTVQVIVH